MSKLFGTGIITIQAAQTGPNPEIALFVFDDGCDVAVAQAVGDVRVGFIDFECIPIVTIQAIFGAKPQKPPAVLKDHAH
jgi:hypothetical protein